MCNAYTAICKDLCGTMLLKPLRLQEGQPLPPAALVEAQIHGFSFGKPSDASEKNDLNRFLFFSSAF